MDAYIQQHGSAITKRVGGLQQRIRREIGNDVAVAAGEFSRRLGDIVTFLETKLFQGEVLIEEFSGGVVVVDGEARARNAVIIGRLFDQGQFRFDPGMAEIADSDLNRAGRERMGGRDTQGNRTEPTIGS